MEQSNFSILYIFISSHTAKQNKKLVHFFQSKIIMLKQTKPNQNIVEKILPMMMKKVYDIIIMIMGLQKRKPFWINWNDVDVDVDDDDYYVNLTIESFF